MADRDEMRRAARERIYERDMEVIRTYDRKRERQVLIDAVKAYALANYNKDGWDYIVEVYEDADIDEFIGRARTVDGAIRKVRAVAKLKDDYRKDIEATAF